MNQRNKEGKKLYPVCNWEANQHKLYNAHDRASIEMYETDYSEKACDEVDRIEHLIDVFNGNVHDGIVYATWEDGIMIKEYVGAYDIRH